MVHSYVTLQIPLFVSYISHSPTRIPWRHYDLSTDLRLTFVYDTAKMWTEGIGTPPESELPGESLLESCVKLFIFLRHLLPDINEDPLRWAIGGPVQDSRPIPWHVCC